MLNKIFLMGRLTADPELRRTNSGTAVASFSIAVDRDYSGKDSNEKQTDFIECVAWKSSAEFVSKYFSKGRMACVCGRLQIRPWTDKDGNKRRTAEVVVESIYFADSKKNSNEAAPSYDSTAAPAPSYSYGAPAAPAPVDFAVLEDDDAELPF